MGFSGPVVEPGAVWFRLCSRHATGVRLVLFDGPGAGASRRMLDLDRIDEETWGLRVEGAGPGQIYGYMVDGPWDPEAGHRFDPDKLLLDPCARAVTGKFGGDPDEHIGWDPSSGPDGPRPSRRSNIDAAARSVIASDEFDWQDVPPPRIPMADLVIYEMHVRGFTRHPSSGVAHPGTYAGVVEKIPHLVDLGVNAVELLPVQESHTERRLADLGLVNYWGYNPIAFFAPDVRFASGSAPGCQVDEFRTMVRELHRAGIEVILDVVFNHTGEQGARGPTLSLRGVDNTMWYHLRDGGRYVDWTGCGNTVRCHDETVARTIVGCLEHWVASMGVDGFRFDLAPVLGRGPDGRFDPGAPFFRLVEESEVLEGSKMMAEAWDLHPEHGDESGRFPPGWSEWNGRFRNAVRRFVRGDGGVVSEMGWRLTGSADVHHGHRPSRSVNYITCHDGFTLADLVTYDHKHNEANGEEGRDGEYENHSWNCGWEGPTDDPLVRVLRRRLIANHLVALFVSRGVPMLPMGDEVLRSQRGNNNAYCQDGDISWLDWRLAEENADVLDLVRALVALRRAHPVLRCDCFLDGADHDRDDVPDIVWYGSRETGDGDAPAWNDPRSRSIAFRLDGSEVSLDDGAPDADVLVVLNASPDSRTFPLPDLPGDGGWFRIVDTSRSGPDLVIPPDARADLPGERGTVRVPQRASLVFRTR